MGAHARSTFVCLLAFLAAGCSGGAPKAQIVSTSEQRLVARAEPMDEGRVRLRVGREWTREIQREALRADGVQVAGEPIQESHGNVGMSVKNPDGPGMDAVGSEFGRAICFLLEPLVWLVENFLSWSGMTANGRPHDLTFETVYDPSWKTSIEPASGEFFLELGAQPKDGYMLDADTVRRLGPEVVVRDHDLSVATRLPDGR